MNTYRVVLTILELLSMSMAQAPVHERKVRDGNNERFWMFHSKPRSFVSRNYFRRCII